MSKLNRILGCIIGGAIGDAMGGPYEGRCGPISLDATSPWHLSDDTQLTLATCEAIAETGQVEPATIADRFRVWFHERRITGIGASTYKALSELEAGGHWALVGARGERAAGNGAAMRIAPLAFCVSCNVDSDRRTIRDVARITHHHDEAYAGALAVVAAVRMAWEGRWTGSNLMSTVAAVLPNTLVRDRLEELSQFGLSKFIAEVAAVTGTTGYVAESVPLALYGAQFIHKIGFQSVLEALIQAGGDTDTIAAIAGQVMGASCGLEGFPTSLVERLPDKDSIEATVTRFAESIL